MAYIFDERACQDIEGTDGAITTRNSESQRMLTGWWSFRLFRLCLRFNCHPRGQQRTPSMLVEQTYKREKLHH
jgi:hypothetical protein